MRPIVTDPVVWSIGLSICHSPAKTAEPIEMPFGLRTRGGLKEPCIRWGFRCPRWKGQFWGTNVRHFVRMHILDDSLRSVSTVSWVRHAAHCIAYGHSAVSCEEKRLNRSWCPDAKESCGWESRSPMWSIQPFGHNTLTSQTDKTGRTDKQRSDSIGRPFYKRSPKTYSPWAIVWRCLPFQ